LFFKQCAAEAAPAPAAAAAAEEVREGMVLGDEKGGGSLVCDEAEEGNAMDLHLSFVLDRVSGWVGGYINGDCVVMLWMCGSSRTVVLNRERVCVHVRRYREDAAKIFGVCVCV